MSSRIISQNYTPCILHLTKNVPLLPLCLLPPPCMHCPTPSPKYTIWGKPCRWRKNPAQQQKKNAHFPHQKNPPHQTAFSCNYPIQASIIAAVIITVSFFLTSGLIYRCIMLISRWFLSLICGMTKALNDQNSSNQNSQPPYPPSNAIWKTLLQLLLFFFIPSLFYFKLYKLFLTPFQLWLHSLQAN